MFHQVLHYSFSFQDIITIPQGKLILANYIYANLFYYHKHFFPIRETNSSNTGLRDNSGNQRIKHNLKYHVRTSLWSSGWESMLPKQGVLGSVPGQQTGIPRTAWCGQNIKKLKVSCHIWNEKSKYCM